MSFIVASFSILFLLTLSAAKQTHFTTPSGTKISVNHLAAHITSNPTLSSLNLVEHVGDHIVLHNQRLHIPSLAPDVIPVSSHSSLSIYLNGEPASVPDTIIHKGTQHSFVFVHIGDTKTLAAAWGPGLSLHPVNIEKHPGVLVNLARIGSDQVEYDLSDDLVISPAQEEEQQSPSPSPFLSSSREIVISRPNMVRRGISSRVTEYDLSDDIVSAPGESPSPSPNLSILNAVRQSTTCGPNDTPRYLEIALSFSNEFCALQADSAPVTFAAVQALVLLANEPFKKQTCVRLSLVHLDGYCKSRSDPFGKPNDLQVMNCPSRITRCSPGRKILDLFEQEYKSAPRSETRRDLAYFLSGYDDGTTTSGMAFPSATCSTVTGYAWSERASPIIFAHEVGHTLGAPHDPDGIMRDRVGSDDPLDFSTRSVSAMTRFVANDPSASCISREKVQCDETCPGRCVRGLCVATAPAVLPDGVVACVPIISQFKCTEKREIGGRTFSFAVDCPRGFNFVEPLASSSGPKFCCSTPSESRKVDGIPTSVSVTTLIFRFADGRREEFSGYVADQGAVTSGTILTTEISPDCTGSTGGQGTVAPTTIPPTTMTTEIVTTIATTTTTTPTSTSTTTITESVTTVTTQMITSTVSTEEISSTTAMTTTTTKTTAKTTAKTTTTKTTTTTTTASTAALTDSTTQTTEITTTTIDLTTSSTSNSSSTKIRRSCADTFFAKLGPVCQTTRLGTMLRPGLPLIIATLTQRNGKFVVTLQSLGLFGAANAKLQVARAARREDIEMKKVRGESVTEVMIEVNMKDVSTEGEEDTCCGRRLFVAIKVEICSLTMTDCEELYEWFGTPMRCGDPCRGRSGVPVAMSSMEVCPRCIG